MLAEVGFTQTQHIFSATGFVVMCAMLFWRIGNGVPRSGHYRYDTGRGNEHPEDHQRLQDGRSRNAAEDHSPMDVAAEGQAADARAGSRLCEEGSRAECTEAKPTRTIRKSGGLAFATDRQVSYVC